MDDPRESEAAYDSALDASFPASDPPSATNPTNSVGTQGTSKKPAPKPLKRGETGSEPHE
jgi:hypothetical protein